MRSSRESQSLEDCTIALNFCSLHLRLLLRLTRKAMLDGLQLVRIGRVCTTDSTVYRARNIHTSKAQRNTCVWHSGALFSPAVHGCGCTSPLRAPLSPGEDDNRTMWIHFAQPSSNVPASRSSSGNNDNESLRTYRGICYHRFGKPCLLSIKVDALVVGLRV